MQNKNAFMSQIDRHVSQASMRRHGSIRRLFGGMRMQQRGRHLSLEPIPCHLPPRNQGAPKLRHYVPYMCQNALPTEKKPVS